MEKQLILLRHAKAEPGESGRPDYERILAPSGLDDAYRVGRYFALQGIDPDVILCSTASRTRQTESRVRAATTLKAETLFLEELYLAPAEDIVRVIRSFSTEETQSLLVIGHNPGLEECVSLLTGEEVAMSTSALAIIGLKTGDFTQIGKGAGVLRGLVTPRSLPLSSD
jgi:phosphohistidine phosphatase